MTWARRGRENESVGLSNLKRMSKMRYSRYALLLFLPLVLQSQSFAGDETDHQIWLDFYPHFYLSEKVEYYGDAGTRIQVSDFSWAQVYMRPSVRFHRAGHFELHGGLGLFYSYNKDQSNQFELRPWQGAKLRWPDALGLTFTHYLRLEQRFVFDTQESWDASFSLRVRYNLSTKVFVSTKLFLPLYVELFEDVGPSVDERYVYRLRLGAGTGYRIDKIWTAEFVFTVQESRSGSDQTFSISNLLFQFRIRKYVESVKLFD